MAGLQFNSETNSQDLVSLTSFLLGGGVTISSSGDYTLKDFTLLANRAMSKIWSLIFAAKSGWKFDDGNNTDLPQGTINLADGTSKYPLPTDALTIERIEVDDGNGNDKVLQIISQDEIDQAIPEFFNEGGIPIYARVLNGTIEIFPTPNYSVTNGFKVYFLRDMVDFVPTDTTKKPGFATPFHDMVAIFAAKEFAEARGLTDKIVTLQGKWDRKAEELQYYYGNRYDTEKPQKVVPKYYSAR